MEEEKVEALIQLYEANVSLLQKLGAIMRRSGQRWSELGQEAMTEAISDARAELKELLGATDAPALLAFQTRIVQRHWEARQRWLDGMLWSASEDAALAGEISGAVAAWYQQTIRMVSVANELAPVAMGWIKHLNGLGIQEPNALYDVVEKPQGK